MRSIIACKYIFTATKTKTKIYSLLIFFNGIVRKRMERAKQSWQAHAIQKNCYLSLYGTADENWATWTNPRKRNLEKMCRTAIVCSCWQEDVILLIHLKRLNSEQNWSMEKWDLVIGITFSFNLWLKELYASLEGEVVKVDTM